MAANLPRPVIANLHQRGLGKQQRLKDGAAVAGAVGGDTETGTAELSAERGLVTLWHGDESAKHIGDLYLRASPMTSLATPSCKRLTSWASKCDCRF